MKLRQRHALVAVIAASVLALSACGTAAPSEGSGDGAPRAGGSATVYIDEMPATLQARESNTETVNYPIYGNLIRFGEGDVQVGVLAEGIEPQDPSHWTLVLRDGLVFSDGTPLDAEAVKWNWEWHADEANSSTVSGLAQQIAAMTAVDERTLEIELQEPNVDFDFAVADGGMNAMGSPTAMEADITAFGQKPVTAGPFLVDEFLPGERLTLVRNPDYYDPEKPYLDELTILPVGDFQQRLNAMSTGENAIAYASSGAEALDFREIGLEVVDATSANGGYHYMLSNLNAPFDDIRVRQAAVHAIDLDEFNDAIYDGEQRIGDVPFQSSSPYYTAGVEQLGFDRDAAQALFDEYAADVGPVEFTILTYNVPAYVLEAEWLAQQYNTYDGVSATVEVLESGPFFERVFGGQYQFTWFGMSWLGSGTGAQLRTRLYTDAPQNFSKYSNPEVDALFDQAAETLDPAELSGIIADILTIAFEEAPLLWTWGVSSSWAVSGDVAGLEVWGPHFYAAEELYLTSAG